jgi:MarR family 2-MHQ and catechol resistance regulon transcriptional repressor
MTGTHLWLILSKANHAVESHARAHVESLGICLSDFAVLEALLHKGPLPVNTLGKKVLLTSGSITTAIDRMTQKNLVRRTPHPDDGRISLVELTPIGNKLIKNAFSQHVAAMERATSVLNAKEKKQLAALLKKLGIAAAIQQT